MRFALGLRTILRGTHLVVLVLPLAVALGSGLVRREMSRHAAIEVHRMGPLAVRLVEGGLAEGRSLEQAARRAVDVLRPEGDAIYPVWTAVWAPGVPVASNREVQLALPEVAQPVWQGVPSTWFVQPPAPPLVRLADVLIGRGDVLHALPVRHEGQVVAAVVVMRQATRLGRLLFVVYAGAVPAVLLLSALIAGLLGSALASRLSRSLGELAAITRRVAAGELDAMRDLRLAPRSRIAEVRALSTDVARMTARLRQRMAWVEEFASNAAHELRTPLSTLMGSAELLLDHPHLPDAERERLLRGSLEQLRRLDALITGLLQLARAERAVELTPVDLDALLDEVANGHGVVREGSAGQVRGHVPSLRQVADNLLSNARRHGRAPVRLLATRHGGEAGFDVVDAGDGVAPEHRGRLFERFFTTDRERGIGLGLVLVAAVVEAHGGRMIVDSGPSRFGVRLPSEVDRP